MPPPGALLISLPIWTRTRGHLETCRWHVSTRGGLHRSAGRAPPLGPKALWDQRFQPDFSAFSGLFPIEHFVAFPSDPNRNLERKAPEDKFHRLPEHFRQAVQSFLAIFFSKRYSSFTAPQFLRRPFSHAVQIILLSTDAKHPDTAFRR